MVGHETRDGFLQLVHEPTFLRRMLLHFCNNRVQDFQDPLTSTLVLMATAPVQMVFCESGLLVFKTNLLPVMSYSLLSHAERATLFGLLERLSNEQLHATIESSGQYTLTVLPFTQNQGTSPTVHALCKLRLLTAFVDLMQQQHLHGGVADPAVNRTLCNIVLQRFWSRVSTPSDIVMAVMRQLEEEEKPAKSPEPDPSLLTFSHAKRARAY